MLPDGWSEISLGDAFSFKNGLNGDKKLYGAGTKFVNVMDVFRGPRLRVSEIVGSMTISPKQLSTYSVQHGDVLFNRTSETRDEIALATVFLDTAPAVFGGFVIRARPMNDDITPEFCVYGFQSAAMRRAMIRLGQGAIRANIGQGDLNKVKWRLPPLSEQRRIAEILSTWDDAIAATEKLIANAQAQKKALMQSLLTAKKRLPGFAGEWESTTLAKVVQVIVSNVDKKSVEGERPVRLCNYMDVYRADRIEADAPFMAATATALQVERFALKIGDVLITKDSETPSDIAVPSYVVSTAADLICGYHLALIRPKKESSGQFLKFYFEHPPVQHFYASRANGATRFGLTIGAIESAPIAIPPFSEQQRIGEIIADAELEVERLKPILAKLRQEKSALMQQLLTGKRRVKVDEREDA